MKDSTKAIRTQASARCRWQFRHAAICTQFVFALIISLSLPAVWGLARPITAAKGMNNLSPIEQLFLDSRLEGIRAGIKNDYSSMNTTTQTFIFPGAGGVDENVLALADSEPNSNIIDWKEYRGSILTASFDSEAVGEAVADLVICNIKNGNDSERTPLSSIQFIGISVGAFAANAAATVVHRHLAKQKLESTEKNDFCESLDVHLVLLDPFCGRGIFASDYGRDNFGKHATTALQILNTDDPVPTTNEALPLCYCLDVTDAPQRQDFLPLPGDSMHSWPLVYFVRHYRGTEDGMDSASPLLPRGKVEKVS